MKRISWCFGFVLWYCLFDLSEKQISIYGSCLFCGMEMIWYRYWYQHWWTSWQQLVCGIWTLPLLLKCYLYCNEHLLLVPIWVWMFELVCGHYLLILYNNRNPAWCYRDIKGSICNGTILFTWQCYFRWILLGIIVKCLRFLFSFC